jgi:hypothetical protein
MKLKISLTAGIAIFRLPFKIIHFELKRSDGFESQLLTLRL